MWRCEACETTIPADSAFCPYCGRAVAVEPPPPPAPEPPSEPEPPLARTQPRLRHALTAQARAPMREALPRTVGLAAQPIDRLVALLGGVLTAVGFLAVVAGDRGAYPWLGLGLAALAVAIYLRLDRPPQDR